MFYLHWDDHADLFPDGRRAPYATEEEALAQATHDVGLGLAVKHIRADDQPNGDPGAVVHTLAAIKKAAKHG